MTAHVQSHWRLVNIEHIVEALKGIRQRVEVLAHADVVCCHGFHNFTACCPKGLLIEDYRKVCVVRFDILLDGIELQAVDIAEALAVASHSLATFRDFLIDMAQVADAHRRAELIHLGIGTDSIHRLRAADAEVLQPIELLAEFLIAEASSTAFNRMEDLRCMETETGNITKRSRTLALVLDAKRVRRIIDDLQLILVGNPRDLLDIADIAVDMNWHDGTGAVRDQRLELVDIYREILWIDITKDRRQAIADNRMRRRSKRKRRRDDLSLQIHRLQRKF